MSDEDFFSLVNEQMRRGMDQMVAIQEREIRAYLRKERTHRMNIVMLVDGDIRMERLDSTHYTIVRRIGFRRFKPAGWVAPLP